MSTLNARLDALLYTDQPGTQWDELVTLFQNASGSTTIWGTKVISVAGYSDTVSILDLAAKINLSVTRYFIEFEKLSRNQRLDGLDVMHKVTELNWMADSDLEESSVFVQLLGIIQEFFFSLFRDSFDENKDNALRLFTAYHPLEFTETFPRACNEKGIILALKQHVTSDGDLFTVSYWMLKYFDT